MPLDDGALEDGICFVGWRVGMPDGCTEGLGLLVGLFVLSFCPPPSSQVESPHMGDGDGDGTGPGSSSKQPPV